MESGNSGSLVFWWWCRRNSFSLAMDVAEEEIIGGFCCFSAPPTIKKAIQPFELNYNTNLQQQQQQQQSAASHTSIRGRSILSLRSSSSRGRLCHRVKSSFSSSVLSLFLRCDLSVLPSWVWLFFSIQIFDSLRAAGSDFPTFLLFCFVGLSNFHFIVCSHTPGFEIWMMMTPVQFLELKAGWWWWSHSRQKSVGPSPPMRVK